MTPYPTLRKRYEILETLKVAVLNALLWVLFVVVAIYCAFEYIFCFRARWRKESRVRRPH